MGNGCEMRRKPSGAVASKTTVAAYMVWLIKLGMAGITICTVVLPRHRAAPRYSKDAVVGQQRDPEEPVVVERDGAAVGQG